MSQQPILVASADRRGESFWCVDLEKPQNGVSRDAPARLAERFRSRRVRLTIPGTDVLLTDVELPRMSRSRLSSALPYALEARLLSDIDTLQFAVGQADEVASRTPVAVVARQTLGFWLQAAQPLVPESVVPEPLLVPWSPGKCSIVLEPGTALVRLGRVSGFAVEPSNLPRFLRSALRQTDEPVHEIEIMADSAGGGVPDALLVELTSLSMPLRTRLERLERLEWLTEAAKRAPALDLLAHEQAPGHRRRQSFRGWKQAWVLLLLLACVRSAVSYVETTELRARVAGLDRQIDSTYQRLFNDAAMDSAAASSLRGYLSARFHSETRGSQRLLALLSHLSASLGESDNAGVRDLDFRHGTLRVTVEVADLIQFESFKSALNEVSKLDVEFESVTAGADGGVSSTLSLTTSPL